MLSHIRLIFDVLPPIYCCRHYDATPFIISLFDAVFATPLQLDYDAHALFIDILLHAAADTLFRCFSTPPLMPLFAAMLMLAEGCIFADDTPRHTP